MPSFWIVVALCFATGASLAESEHDRKAFRAMYQQKFPQVGLDDFVLGVYAIDTKLRAQYDAINEFPPYEFDLDEGKDSAYRRLPDGSNLVECLGENRRTGVNNYPIYDEKKGEVISLPVAINRCLERAGQAPLSYRKLPLSKTLAHLNYAARGTRRDVAEPASEQSRSAYNAGKVYFNTKRGQLNLSCADCHVRAAGKHLREQTLAPLLGAVNHYPVYGLNWGALGTLHQRFVGCLEQVNAESEDLQSKVFRELEYFLTVMANGLPMVGPGIHR